MSRRFQGFIAAILCFVCPTHAEDGPIRGSSLESHLGLTAPKSADFVLVMKEPNVVDRAEAAKKASRVLKSAEWKTVLVPGQQPEEILSARGPVFDINPRVADDVGPLRFFATVPTQHGPLHIWQALRTTRRPPPRRSKVRVDSRCVVQVRVYEHHPSAIEIRRYEGEVIRVRLKPTVAKSVDIPEEQKLEQVGPARVVPAS